MSWIRKYPLVSDEIYHIISRSIAGYQIFNTPNDYLRFIDALKFYKFKMSYKFSKFRKLSLKSQKEIFQQISPNWRNQIVQLIAYCLMPTHIHLILKQLLENGIPIYMNNLLNSYTRYFNTLHSRKGPLWESRFKNIIINDDQQLLHLTRYVHLNPSSAGLADNPEKWLFSSYHEYIGKINNKICQFDQEIGIDPKKYKKFVESRISYQQQISKIKALLLEDYTG